MTKEMEPTGPEVVEPGRTIEIDPRKVTLDSAGQVWRHILVRAPAGAVADDLRSPAIWKKVQGNAGCALIKLDRLFILARDESWYCEAIVTYASNAEANLAIQKVGSFRELSETLFSDGTYSVFWDGSSYGVRRAADGVSIGSEGFSTEAAAQAHLRSQYATAQSTHVVG